MNLYENLSNEELICLYRKTKDEELYNYFFKRNIRFCNHIACKYRNIDELDVLIQIAMIGMIKAFDTFDTNKNSKFATYAGVIMTNEILMYARKEKRNKNVSMNKIICLDGDGNEKILEESLFTKNYSVDENLITKDTIDELNLVMNNLKEKENEIIKMRYFEELNQNEVANKLNISQSYVSRLERRSLLKMRKELIKINSI